MLKGAESEPNPMGDHREKATVATIAIVGGEIYVETKLAKLWPNSGFEQFASVVFIVVALHKQH